jgi:peroxiredoxin
VWAGRSTFLLDAVETIAVEVLRQALEPESIHTVTFLADGNGDFAKSIGLEMDGAPSGLGIRSKRYAMLVEDGVVKALHVEDTPRNAVESSAERLLADL